ncbi:cyanophycin metabolism-associated DUF1854 family protein [Leptothrix discophora]|uniref:DUF1854 domain-containing protein n=1 Tax=Leptothrix discophora TaxID=89 RepID=A0ABT9G3K9_LEPDI|nr:DUF1854 domain-containing protein [Leptothrix discophora]MDP4301054.1 DUF1854 domain-containing protein [Leptothrix discophora]
MEHPNDKQPWTLARNAMGRLVWTGLDGVAHVGVVPVRAFPLGAPDDGLSLVSPDGHELVWIDRLDALPEPDRTLIADELAAREFVPVIERLVGVSTFSTPSTWTVETDRGATTFVLKAEEDIRRLNGSALLIASAHGIAFRIRDRFGLDRASRRLLERFL